MMYNCNDYFQYLYRSSFDMKIRFNRKYLIDECSHEFVLLKKGGWTSCGGFHSSDYEYEDDIVECVHCGLTNKYKELEKALRQGKLIGSYTSVETIEFDIYEKKNKIELIVDLEIDSKHGALLYRIAKKMFPNEDNSKLVEIMVKLNELETDDEKRTLNTIDDAADLMVRFKALDERVLVKKK